MKNFNLLILALIFATACGVRKAEVKKKPLNTPDIQRYDTSNFKDGKLIFADVTMFLWKDWDNSGYTVDQASKEIQEVIRISDSIATLKDKIIKVSLQLEPVSRAEDKRLALKKEKSDLNKGIKAQKEAVTKSEARVEQADEKLKQASNALSKAVEDFVAERSKPEPDPQKLTELEAAIVLRTTEKQMAVAEKSDAITSKDQAVAKLAELVQKAEIRIPEIDTEVAELEKYIADTKPALEEEKTRLMDEARVEYGNLQNVVEVFNDGPAEIGIIKSGNNNSPHVYVRDFDTHEGAGVRTFTSFPLDVEVPGFSPDAQTVQAISGVKFEAANAGKTSFVLKTESYEYEFSFSYAADNDKYGRTNFGGGVIRRQLDANGKVVNTRQGVVKLSDLKL